MDCREEWTSFCTIIYRLVEKKQSAEKEIGMNRGEKRASIEEQWLVLENKVFECITSLLITE